MTAPPAFLRALLLILMAWLAALLPAAPASAQLPQPGRNAIASQLLPEKARVAPGESVTLAIAMRPQPGWHGYWKNPGDAGTEMKVAWRLPEGVSVGAIQYPVPTRLTIAGLMNYVYEADYALLVDLRIPRSARPGSRLPVAAKMDYLACTDQICVPETATIATELLVVARRESAPAGAPFEKARRELPKPLGSEARFQLKAGRLRLAVPLPASFTLHDSYVFPVTEGAIDYSAPQHMAREGDFLIVAVKGGAELGSLDRFEGILATGRGGLAFTARRGEVPEVAGIEIAPVAEPVANSVGPLYAFLAALVGGLILNIMPCVFPIISLKALSLARAGGDERAARREALAYTAGAVLMCLALGAVLLAVRAGGETVGWAFQLQDPRVILFLLLLTLAIALNLAGLYALPAVDAGGGLAGRGGIGGSFWTGLLAAFVATPCTGPFMGVALGAALVLPAAAALAVFVGLGLGLALPFLLIGFLPPLRRRLPSPGAWMGRLRRILSIPMFLTALGLAWILGRQVGAEGMVLGLGAGFALALALWAVGRHQDRARAWLPLAPAVAIALAALAGLPTASAPTAAPETGLPSEPFSEARLAQLRAEGRPVFVYFTADWCLTCKVNERGVLARDEVAESFARNDVAILAGDWTLGDPAIGRFLESHGRTGVPLYLYYAPGEGPEVLPQILTVSRLQRLGDPEPRSQTLRPAT